MWSGGCLLLLLACSLIEGQAGTTSSTEANVPIELTFRAQASHSDPFNGVTLDVLFRAPDKSIARVPAFWDGSNTWKARYASSLAGTHYYQSECSDPHDQGLHHVSGEISVTPYSGNNLLYKHGPVKIAADHRHFEYADGTPFFWLGDTWWMGLCHRLRFPDEFAELTSDRVSKGFTVIQIVAGLYPDMPPFDSRGANEAGFPWQTNWSSVRPEYFQAADRRLKYLVDAGLTPCLVGAWGYFMPWMGVEKAKQHWRYLIARYGAYPMIWCAAGEANLPYYLAKGFPYDDRKQVDQWSEVMRSIRETDPYHRPLSIHPTGLGSLSARGCVTNSVLLDFDMLQTGHGMQEVVFPTLNTLRTSHRASPVMPVLDSEVCYEMLGDSIPAEVPRLMFWACMLSGAAGHTYGANGIWQCNRPGEPHGASPHGGTYGKISWSDAMKLPGSTQLGWGKRFLEKLDWTHLSPRPAMAAWASAPHKDQWGKWIWYPEGEPARDAPAAPRFFRKSFVVTNREAIRLASFTGSADDKLEVWINGQRIGQSESWRNPFRADARAQLVMGANVIAIRAENMPANVAMNPAGLNASLRLQTGQGEEKIFSDETWRVSQSPSEGWQAPEFDDGTWKRALVIGTYGDAPWGRFADEQSQIEPLAASVGENSLLIYAPRDMAFVVRELKSARTYNLDLFDPVNGDSRRLEQRRTDAEGSLSVPAPGLGHDALVLIRAVQ